MVSDWTSNFHTVLPDQEVPDLVDRLGRLTSA